MKTKLTIGILATVLSSSVLADLKSTVHDYGVTMCDSFVKEITKEGKDSSNWRWDLYYTNINGKNPSNTVVIKSVYGQLNDTVQVDYTLQQQGTTCYMTKRATVTTPDSCVANVDKNYWYNTNEMKGLDYDKYKNKGGVVVYTKNVQGGCVLEYFLQDIETNY